MERRDCSHILEQFYGGKMRANGVMDCRSIAFTALSCKIMERMSRDRLVYKVEEGWFMGTESGLYKGRGTMFFPLTLR